MKENLRLIRGGLDQPSLFEEYETLEEQILSEPEPQDQVEQNKYIHREPVVELESAIPVSTEEAQPIVVEEEQQPVVPNVLPEVIEEKPVEEEASAVEDTVEEDTVEEEAAEEEAAEEDIAEEAVEEEAVETEVIEAEAAEEDNELREDDIESNERRWAWAEINLDAVRHNLHEIRKMVGAQVKIMAVVKANAYGHGAVEVSRVALKNGATMLGVATVEEGMVLRQAGIEAPILILSEPPLTAIPLVLKYNLISTVFTSDYALQLGELADSMKKVAPYHLKIDSGMNRVGVRFNEAADFLTSIDFHRGLELQGVFTHFATADALDTFDYNKQMDRFIRSVEAIKRAGIRPGIVHAANSAAAIRYKKAHFDMVRVGIAMYGLHPSESTHGLIDLQPAMSVKARVTCVKSVLVGEGVSYGYTYRSPGNVLIATIPVGYGDGLQRVLSNKIDFLVKGRPCPQVGTICMDMCMFEVNQRATLKTPALVVEMGDEVTIIGREGRFELTLDAMAQKLETINYELACQFGLRLGKVYLARSA
jgi:alanine racemase